MCIYHSYRAKKYYALRPLPVAVDPILSRREWPLLLVVSGNSISEQDDATQGNKIDSRAKENKTCKQS